jgi:hypothetical protein
MFLYGRFLVDHKEASAGFCSNVERATIVEKHRRPYRCPMHATDSESLMEHMGRYLDEYPFQYEPY